VEFTFTVPTKLAEKPGLFLKDNNFPDQMPGLLKNKSNSSL
jgi:hypothetical protein